MQRYILSRIGQGIFVLFALSILIFVAGRLAGDPAETLLPPMSSESEIQRIRQSLGLDQPLPIQYWAYISSAVRGDLGTSYHTRRPVTELIMERVPNSASLGAIALLFATIIALPVGVIAAVRRGSWIDTALRTSTVFGIAMPGFWVALMLMYVFAVQLHWLPTARMGGPAHFVLPAFCMSLHHFAGKARLVYSGMVTALEADYILLARVKSLPERLVVWKHAFRNALIPVVTMLGMNLATLVSGSVAIEIVFAWPGVGRLAYEALTWRDLPLMQGTVMMVAAVIVFMNVAVDVLYVYIDPRIKYTRA